MTRQQWIQLVIVLIFFGFSALKVVFGKLQQQAAKRKIEIERERQRLEAYRTGRPVEEITRAEPARRVGPTPEQLQELARRRAAQLEELRRVQAAKRGKGSPGPSPSRDVVRSIPGSTGPTVPGTQAPRAPERSRDRPRDGDRRQRSEKRRPPEQRQPEPRQPQPEPVVRRSPVRTAPPAPVVESLSTKGNQVRSAMGVPVFGAKMSAQEIRRAIVAAEILGRPVSERA